LTRDLCIQDIGDSTRPSGFRDRSAAQAVPLILLIVVRADAI